jgi:hypothetical protein
MTSLTEESKSSIIDFEWHPGSRIRRSGYSRVLPQLVDLRAVRKLALLGLEIAFIGDA